MKNRSKAVPGCFSSSAAVVAAFLVAAAAGCADEVIAREIGTQTMTPEREAAVEAALGRAREKLAENNRMRVHRTADGTILYSGRLHEGFGPAIKGRITPPAVNIRSGEAAGVDENGHPMTVRQKQDRALVNKVVGDLVRNGDVRISDNRIDQRRIWQQKAEETRRQVAENGPITTKTFIYPGKTPEESAVMNDPDAAVRVNADGSYTYVVRRNDRPDAAEQSKAPAVAVDSTTQDMVTPALVRERRNIPGEKARSDTAAGREGVHYRISRTHAEHIERGSAHDSDLLRYFPDLDAGAPD